VHPLERPLLFIGGASEKIENGDVVDEELRDLIKSMMQALVSWTLRIRVKS
jgi:hypothetical protein